MRAIIMAGGKGTRLYPYTTVIPKPLVPIGNKPILEIIISQLVYYGFDHITISVGYQHELIMAVIGDGTKYNCKIDYSIEEAPLNTIGPLALIEDLGDLDEPFLVMNGDILTNLNYLDLYQYHKKNGSVLTVSSYKRHVQISLGVISQDEQNQITSFVEKPEFDYQVSMGIYILEPELLKEIPKGEPFGFNHLMAQLLDKKAKMSTYNFDGKWLDMGTMDDLENAIVEFNANPSVYLPETQITQK